MWPWFSGVSHVAVVQRCSPFAMWPWFNGVRHVAVVQRWFAMWPWFNGGSPCGRGSTVFAMWLWFNGVRHVAVVQRCSPKGSGPRRTQVSSGELCLHVMESTCNRTFGLNPSYNPLHGCLNRALPVYPWASNRQIVRRSQPRFTD